jgi:hybrid cluster-associated redox disulfide protein
MRRSHFHDPQTTLSTLFGDWPVLVQVFLDRGMLCPGCPIAPFHTLSDACLEYNLDEESFRVELIEACVMVPGDQP